MSNKPNPRTYSKTDKYTIFGIVILSSLCIISLLWMAYYDTEPALVAQVAKTKEIAKLNEMIQETEVIKELQQKIAILQSLVPKSKEQLRSN